MRGIIITIIYYNNAGINFGTIKSKIIDSYEIHGAGCSKLKKNNDDFLEKSVTFPFKLSAA